MNAPQAFAWFCMALAVVFLAISFTDKEVHTAIVAVFWVVMAICHRMEVLIDGQNQR